MSERTHSVAHRRVTARHDFGHYVWFVEGFDGNGVQSLSQQHTFLPVADPNTDVIRGDVPETEHTPVIYVGDSLSGRYPAAADIADIPADVLETLRDADVTLLDGTDAGWHNWDGRPEWSDTYIDFDDAEVVDVAGIIAERGEDSDA
jgi:hypothetical protein